MCGALKPGLRSVATLILVVNVVGKLKTTENSCGITWFPCESTAFLCYIPSVRRCCSLVHMKGVWRVKNLLQQSPEDFSLVTRPHLQ